MLNALVGMLHSEMTLSSLWSAVRHSVQGRFRDPQYSEFVARAPSEIGWLNHLGNNASVFAQHVFLHARTPNVTIEFQASEDVLYCAQCGKDILSAPFLIFFSNVVRLRAMLRD